MMKHEFEALAGYEVSIEDYNNIIEPMYMATDLSKEEFVKTISKKRFALKPLKCIVKEMKKLAGEIKETCTHYTDYEKKDALEALAREYVNRKYNTIGDYTSKYATFGISEEMRMTCYYPKSIEIFGTKSYKTIESIELV